MDGFLQRDYFDTQRLNQSDNRDVFLFFDMGSAMQNIRAGMRGEPEHGAIAARFAYSDVFISRRWLQPVRMVSAE